MKTLLCLILIVPPAHCFQKHEEEEIRRSLVFAQPGPEQRLLVDNIDGSITVEGYDGTEVQLIARRSTKADSEKRLQEAKEDVILDIQEKRDRIEVVVKTPWGTRWGYGNRGEDRYYGYSVSFDFQLKVPRKTGLFLRTVNVGDIEVKDVEGVFEVRNVNGNITMTGVAGHGLVGTVNGFLEASFVKSPKDDCSFKTVNGRIDVTFPAGLSADLSFKTFNGKAYTDFDLVPVDGPKMVRREKRGKTFYKLSDSYAVRIGLGGPQLAFDTLNGNITIKRGLE